MEWSNHCAALYLRRKQQVDGRYDDLTLWSNYNCSQTTHSELVLVGQVDLPIMRLEEMQGAPVSLWLLTSPMKKPSVVSQKPFFSFLGQWLHLLSTVSFLLTFKKRLLWSTRIRPIRDAIKLALICANWPAHHAANLKTFGVYSSAIFSSNRTEWESIIRRKGRRPHKVDEWPRHADCDHRLFLCRRCGALPLHSIHVLLPG